jgi:hypothetical protein
VNNLPLTPHEMKIYISQLEAAYSQSNSLQQYIEKRNKIYLGVNDPLAISKWDQKNHEMFIRCRDRENMERAFC